ncbi:exonuclease SbcC [Caminicella sporogenes DSM 14501]|uniref:Nuclease SbcCD subunit C n=1 Tax=Caminicella sporogenes DSM 14501 TaxID=1121266 RepID=A0A1M6SNB0_9FIRM|nr:SbcC/MukB-like Walker B domain-containing protein [Caminicella sporogenes]RKD26557.1 hypothetical protein BET04_10540 [Caminicella sporogenes]SHK46244.1 exonuclease SbcC [Caminicella sporogenes DSM 14501]
MKPKLLKIAGLNSFVEKQTIDFSKLIEKGLFGIFGPTGSGKSTILDAITIALYGQISRSTKEYINTDSDKLYVCYEFDIGDVEKRKSYKIERSIKRNKNGGITTDFARLCYLDDEGNVYKVIDKVSEVNNEIVKIIGLNHSDFTRSVVLPQGKFSDFLKLSGSDRRNMLERILGLEKYGIKLIEKIKTVRRKNEEELNILNGELSRYEGVSEENLKILKSELKNLQKKEQILRKELAEIDKKYENFSKIWELQIELNNYLEEEKKLSLDKSKIDFKREKLKKAVRALSIKPYLMRYEDILEKINIKKNLLVKLEREIDKLKTQNESTEAEYKKAYEDKEKNLPIIIEKEANLKNALEIKKDVEKLKREKEELAKKYSELKTNITKYEREVEINNSNRKRYLEELNSIEKTINDIKVVPEYREKLNKAWEVEKNLKKLLEEKEKNLKYISKLEEVIKDNNDKLNKINTDIDEKSKLVLKIEEEIKKLEENAPKDRNYIFKKELEIQQMKMILEKAQEDLERKKVLEKELSDITNMIKENEIKLNYLIENFNENNQRLEEANFEIEKLEKLYRASILSLELEEGKPCPVCGSCHHPQKAERVEQEVIEGIKEIKRGLEETREELKGQINKIEFIIEKDKKEEEKKKEEIKKCIDKLKGIEIKQLKIDIDNKEREIDILNEALEQWEVDLKEKRENYDKFVREINSLEGERIRYSESLKKDRERLQEMNIKLEDIEKDINTSKELYTRYKEILKLENIEEKISEVRKNDKKLVNLEKRHRELREIIEKLDRDRENINRILNNEKIELGKIVEKGEEKKKIIDEYEEKIKSVVGDRNLEEYLLEIQENKVNIIKLEETLRGKLEKEKNEIMKKQDELTKIKTSLNTFEKELKDVEKEVKRQLEEKGFEDVEEVNKSLMAEEDIKVLEDEIKRYDDDIKRINDNIIRIKSKLNNQWIDEKEWIKLKKDRETKGFEMDNLKEELGKKKEQINEMNKNIEKVRELNQKIVVLQKKVDMLKDMSKLVSGNRFVEFVAVNHLKYIAREASKRLMDITNKRYSLEIDSQGNFVICDNYNGGVRRDCNTLSGGETFMTSLSLALALSTQIQLKGNASIEFFFLDEGFGTLDNHLLDTVMTSLEKLYEEKLAVGIISHVEELKNRVPVKLIVTPAQSGLHGTKVHIQRN